MGGFVSSVAVHPANMPPEVSTVAFPFYRFATEPLLFADVLQMAIAMLIESLVSDEDTLNDLAVLPDRDNRQILHIEISRHGDQVGITFALHDLFRSEERRVGKTCI